MFILTLEIFDDPSESLETTQQVQPEKRKGDLFLESLHQAFRINHMTEN